MTRMLRQPLEPAAFYYWHDGRDDSDHLASCKQFDPDPVATAAIASEIAARIQGLYPVRERYRFYDPYFELPDADIGPELVVRASAFRIRRPAALPHYDIIEDFTDPEHRVYRIVSTAWKEAIESPEPGIHQFFPHELRFTDGIVSDRFIIREPRRIDTGGPPYFLAQAIEDQFDRIIGYRLTKDGEPIQVTLNGDRVAWNDWVREPRGERVFVSRALAEKLYPLLPKFTDLVPVALSGSTFADNPPRRRAASAETNPNGGFDPGLADTRARPGGRTATEVFRLMEASLASPGPLSRNVVFQSAWMACHDLPERDVLSCARP